MNFVADFEGFHECAYWDVRQWSVGFGNKSYKGECITREEALERKKGVILPIFDSIPNCFTDNQKIALTSYIYNTGGFQMNLRSHINRCDIGSVLHVMRNWGWTANGQVLGGLVKRRTIEIEKFNTN